MWVLNIDDDQDDRELFCDALNDVNPGIDCVAKTSADEALRFLDKSHILPNCIFLDINMPKVGGIECLKQIKNNPKLAEIPVIILSTSVGASDIEVLEGLGVKYIPKESSYKKYVSLLKKEIERIDRRD